MVLTLKVIAIFVILISSTHLVLIPLLAPGFTSGTVLIAGVVGAALIGAWINAGRRSKAGRFGDPV